MNIIITGASSGIGFESVLALILKNENKVVAIARSEEKLEKLYSIATILNPTCHLYYKPFDVTQNTYEKELIPFVKKNLDRVDILINNAGILINKPFKESTQIDFIKMIQYNFLSHIQMIQNILPLMNPNAHIVNIGSMAGFQGSVKFPGMGAYSASKAALHSLTECLAQELDSSSHKIYVNCLAIGSVQTEMLEAAFPGYQSPVTASEMGKYIAEFALNGHKFFNGKIIPVAVTTP